MLPAAEVHLAKCSLHLAFDELGIGLILGQIWGTLYWFFSRDFFFVFGGFGGGWGLVGENGIYQQRHTQKQAPAQEVST